MHILPLWQALDFVQVVLAYLMAMEKTSVEAALASLKQTYRIACPNAGVATPTILYTMRMKDPLQYMIL